MCGHSALERKLCDLGRRKMAISVLTNRPRVLSDLICGFQSLPTLYITYSYILKEDLDYV